MIIVFCLSLLAAWAKFMKELTIKNRIATIKRCKNILLKVLKFKKVKVRFEEGTELVAF
jgi:hypothetical protein